MLIADIKEFGYFFRNIKTLRKQNIEVYFILNLKYYKYSRYAVVFHPQFEKEQSVDGAFLNLKSNLLRKRLLFEILYWIIWKFACLETFLVKSIFLSSSNLLLQVICHCNFVMQIFHTLSKVKCCIIPSLSTNLGYSNDSF